VVLTPENIAAALAERDANDPRGELSLEGALQRLIDSHGGSCLPLAEMDTALLLPWPFVHLIARGRWQWIALLASSKWPTACSARNVVSLWRRYELADNEPRFALDDDQQRDLAEADGDLFQPQLFQELADYLRDRAPDLASLPSASADDREAELMRVQNYVLWLERCVAGCSQDVVVDNMVESNQGRGGRWFHQIGRRVRYFSDLC
jgi:hypothetical protein